MQFPTSYKVTSTESVPEHPPTEITTSKVWVPKVPVSKENSRVLLVSPAIISPFKNHWNVAPSSSVVAVKT